MPSSLRRTAFASLGRIAVQGLERIAVVAVLPWLLCISTSARAEPLADLSGRYVYEEYSLTLADGTILDLAALGLRDAKLSIYPNGAIVTRMTSDSGEEIVSRCSSSDWRISDADASWTEDCPEVGYPIRREIERTPDGLSYSIRFDDARDRVRYGSVDHGVLRRVGEVDNRAALDSRGLAAQEPPRIPLSDEEAREVGERIRGQIRVTPAGDGPDRGQAGPFFDETALARLGCAVPPGSGRYKDVAAPGVSEVRVFVLRSRGDCTIDLFNLIQPTAGDFGQWAGLRAQASGEARARGFETETREGRIGNHSELRVFSKNGAYKGFWYAIESDGVLYVLRVLSAQIRVSPELEDLLREKIALISE